MWVSAPFDQPPLFERVENADELTAIQAEGVGNRPLGLAGALAEQGENAVVVGVETGLLEFGDRPGLHRQAEPGKQEARAGEQLLCDPRTGLGRGFGRRREHHGISIARKRWDLLPWNNSTI